MGGRARTGWLLRDYEQYAYAGKKALPSVIKTCILINFCTLAGQHTTRTPQKSGKQSEADVEGKDGDSSSDDDVPLINRLPKTSRPQTRARTRNKVQQYVPESDASSTTSESVGDSSSDDDVPLINRRPKNRKHPKLK